MFGGGDKFKEGRANVEVILRRLDLENFMGCERATYEFDEKETNFYGANATGKTTVFSGFTWTLFGRDCYGREKFSLRPLNPDGSVKHNVEISATVCLSIDGKEKEFKRTQKEVWRKKRGTDVATLQGNVNEYEIDGYPQSEKDFKQAVADIVDEDLFKTLTNPMLFTSLKWQDQRKMLMQLIDAGDDIDIARDAGGRFDSLIEELERADTDAVKKKYQKQLNEWKKKQTEIPVRIDEAERVKASVDVAAVNKERNKLQKQLEENLKAQTDVSAMSEERNKLQSVLFNLEAEKGKYEREAMQKLYDARMELRQNLQNVLIEINRTENDIDSAKRDVTGEKVNRVVAEMKALREEWLKTKDMTFDESSTICPYCHQPLPEEQQAEMRKHFEDEQKKEIKRISALGAELKASYDRELEKVNDASEKIKLLESDIKQLEAEKLNIENEIKKIPEAPDFSKDTKHQELTAQIDGIAKSLEENTSVSDIVKQLKADEESIRQRISFCEADLARAKNNVLIDERIEGLKEEQLAVAQKVTEAEGRLFLLEEFIRYKMDAISENLNSHFDGVEFTLFNRLLNGATVETCECTVNGVPYASLNNGHRIIAGLQIIKAFQNYNCRYLPVFNDNAEAVSDGNFPDMDCQMIYLRVSNDRKLVIK